MVFAFCFSISNPMVWRRAEYITNKEPTNDDEYTTNGSQ